MTKRKKPAPNYCAELDLALHTATSERDERNMLEASVRSYDGGEPRLQLGRYYRTDPRHEWRYLPLRRLNFADAHVLLDLAAKVLAAAEPGANLQRIVRGAARISAREGLSMKKAVPAAVRAARENDRRPK